MTEVEKKREGHAQDGPDVQKVVDSIILSRYSPAGLVINEDMDILQFRGDISPYLNPQPGKASLNLVKMAGESLAVELRVLIRRAREKDVAVRKEVVKVSHTNIVSMINIEVLAFKTHYSSERLFLVIFEDAAGSATRVLKQRGKAHAKTIGRSHENQVAALSSELATTQRHLKSVIEEYEVSTEELKALNEEVQSSNEEMQSINEELETSKEELQSANEELNTVNDELRSRNEEIAQSNNDLVNVLSGVEIPILLIDNKLQIRRFNTAAAKALNLVASDIGRPISDIRPNINSPDLDKLLLEVVNSLTIRQQEIQDTLGRWYSMKIRPYKTIDNRIDGALLTLEDIHDLKLGMLRIQEARAYAEAIVETVREPLIVLSKDLHVITANDAYYQEFPATPETLEDQYFYELQNGLWNIPKLRALLDYVVTENGAFNEFEVDYEAPGIGRRVMLLNARRVAQENSELILLAIEDITDRRAADEKISKLNRDLQHNLNELDSANKELEAFSYSVSHDLRSPLTMILGSADLLHAGYADRLDDEGSSYLERLIHGAVKMNRTIDALLHLSRISLHGVQRQEVNLSKIAASVVTELREAQSDRSTTVDIQEGITAFADAKLIEIALSNLLGNAWKFTSKTENARIEFGTIEEDGKTAYYVKDNGAGFDQNFSAKLFTPFRRLHSEQDFEGTGIGLATVERVIRRHGGRIWAKGKTNEGAAFFFTLN